jgi:hypothetical protein
MRCLPMRRGGSRPTSPSCRSWCASLISFSRLRSCSPYARAMGGKMAAGSPTRASNTRCARQPSAVASRCRPPQDCWRLITLTINNKKWGNRCRFGTANGKRARASDRDRKMAEIRLN